MIKWRSKKKISLALSSGAAKGLAHLGVIKNILAEGIKIKAIAGSSIGALIGAYFALNYDINPLIEIALETNWQKFLGYLDFNIITISEGGIIRGRNVERFLKELFGEKEFCDCKIPLIIIATDLKTGQAVQITEGKIWKAVRASIAIPGIFTPIRLGKKLLIDGGVSMPVPVKALIMRKLQPVWAINVLSHPTRLQLQDKTSPNLITTLTQSLFIMESAIANTQSEDGEKVISLDTSHVLFYDFPKAKEIIKIGKEVSIS